MSVNRSSIESHNNIYVLNHNYYGSWYHIIDACFVVLLGILKDDQTLREAKISPGIKIMVVGTTLEGLLSIRQPDPAELKKGAAEEAGGLLVTYRKSMGHYTICMYYGLYGNYCIMHLIG